MRNILFSTTRQWNVGDEFILFGAIRIMKAVFPEGINPIIYNRHPDLRTDIRPEKSMRDIKLFFADELSMIAEASFRLCFRDNSIKPSTDAQFIDLVVFAGTPEWSNQRCFDLYELIEKYDIPVIALGIGNVIQDKSDIILRNLHRFSLFTVRSKEFIEPLQGFIQPEPVYLPCPSICSSASDKIRAVEKVKHIGLIYACDIYRSEINNCVSTETYEYLKSLYREIKVRYTGCHISFVCHYIDELPFAYSDFPNEEILYSFDSKDYYDLYRRFDLVIGTRVHGIGCAASMGIPGIALVHDFRGQTAKGFLADEIQIGALLPDALHTIDEAIASAAERSKQIAARIEETKKDYVDLISGLGIKKKRLESYLPPMILPTSNVFEGRAYLRSSLRELLEEPNPELQHKEEQLAQQSLTISTQKMQLAQQSLTISAQKVQLHKQEKLIQA